MKETIINIEGMACNMCESHINSAIRNNFNVKKVTSSHSKNQTVVTSEDSLDPKKVKKVISELGYDYKGQQEREVVEKKGLFGLFK